MAAPGRLAKRLLVFLIVVVGLVPLAAHVYLIDRVNLVAGVSPAKAKELLGELAPMALLVDVRTREEYAAGHIEGAVSWPAAEILALKSFREACGVYMGGEPLIGRPLFLICSSGIQSARATLKLRRLGIYDVRNVEGGMEAWVATAQVPCPLEFARMKLASGETTPLPFRPSPWYEQWAVVFTGLGVKPAYMALSLLVAGILRGQKSPDLAALRWAMICFFVGEAFCAANYLAFHDTSYLFEYLHSFGMVLCFGLATYAILEGMDLRLIRYSAPEEKCAALGLCRACIKYADVPCGLRRLFLVLIPATIILAFMPLLAEPSTPSYNTDILGTLYNYSHPVIHQIYEFRFCPAVAMVLLAASFLVLALKRKDPVTPSKMLFAAGMGPLGFSFLRLMLLAPYRDNQVWFVFWEEITELLFVAGAGLVLWIFRRGLFPARSPVELGTAPL